MKLISNYSQNNNISVHYLDSLNDSDFTLVPLLICPGLSEVAEEYVSYALGYTRLHSEQIEKLIIQDYPSEHKAMPIEWSHDYVENYIVPFNRINHIRPETVHGIQRESTQEIITFQYTKPVLIMRGLQNDSLLSNNGLEQYERQFSKIQVEGFSESGHDIRSKEKSKLYETMKAFLD